MAETSEAATGSNAAPGSKLFNENKWYGRRLGPLPIGAWLLVVGGSLAYSRYRKSHVSTTTAKPTDSGIVVDTSAMPTVGNMGSGGGGGGAETNQAITDNTQWYRRAFNVLVGRGFAASAVDSALRKYLDGSTLTVTDKAIVDEALTLVGPAPQPVPSAPITNDDPAPAPGGNAGAITFYDPNASRDRARLNALRSLYKFFGGNVDDWPEVPASGALDSPEFRQAVAAFVRRENDARANDTANGRPQRSQLPTDGTYTFDVHNAAVGAADFFRLQF